MRMPLFAVHRSSLLFASGSSYVSKHDGECEDDAIKDMKSFNASVRNGGRYKDVDNLHSEESNLYKLHKIVPSDSNVRFFQLLEIYFIFLQLALALNKYFLLIVD